MALSSDAESPRGPGRHAADGLGGLAAALLEAVDDGLYVVDREWRFVYANPRACAMWGAARETVIGEVLWQRFPAIVGTRAGQLLRQAVENGEPYEFEVFSPVVKRWLWLRAHPLGDGLTGVHWRDVTERRQTEEALRASEERLRIASETARLGYWERDFATGELRASALCKANFGLPPDAPLSYDQVLAAIDPAHRERVQEASRRAVREGREYESEHPISWPDGSVHWISVRGRCLYAEDGTPLRDIGVTLDITARRRLEQDLRESEERYRLFAEAALEGVVVHDFERILDVSRRFAEMFGYRPEELIGQPVAVLESMVPPEEVAQARRRVATQHTAFNEMACLRRDGTPFTIEYAARHLTYRDRAVRLAIARDITERKRHEAALQRVNETLERQIEERARQLSASRARLRAFFDNSPDWLTLQRATADGRFVYVDLNPTCEAAYGLPRERVIGRRLEEVLGEEAAQVPLHHLREALRTGAPQRYVA